MALLRFNRPSIRFQGPMGVLIGATLFGAIFFLVGGVLFAIGINSYRDGEATKSWTMTTARVLSTSIDENTSNSRDSNGSRRTRTTYEPIVHYEYTVDGTTHEGDHIRAGTYSGSKDRALDIVARYPGGAEVTAFYDPKHPDDAVLEQGADRTGVYLFGGIGGGFAVIGLGALAFAGIFFRRLGRG
jgi:hypothetical protein